MNSATFLEPLVIVPGDDRRTFVDDLDGCKPEANTSCLAGSNGLTAVFVCLNDGEADRFKGAVGAVEKGLGAVGNALNGLFMDA